MAPEFEEFVPLNGFDGSGTDPWQMVPLGGCKIVRLTDGDSVLCHSDNGSIATVDEFSPGLLIINGRTAGETVIRAKTSDGRTIAQLDLTILPKRVVRTSFHFVEDSSGTKTKRRSSEVPPMVETLNKIYLPQANIEFQVLKNRRLKLPMNLHKVVGTKRNPKGSATKWDTVTEWNRVVGHGDAAARFNVFFVWSYEESQTPYNDSADAAAEIGGKNCLFEDKAGTEVGETLAHEAGHVLGVNDLVTSTSQPWLMHGITDVRGRKLPKDHAVLMHSKV